MGKRHKRVPVSKPSSKGLRTCVGCNEKKEPSCLVRFVLTPDQRILVDRYHKAPGRGAYVCFEANCLQRMVKNKGLQRALKLPQLQVDFDGLAAEIVDALKSRVMDLLSIAGLSGDAISGMDVLGRSLKRIEGFVIAQDVAIATRERVERWAADKSVPIVEFGLAEVLGHTQNKPARVVVGISSASKFRTIRTAIERMNRVLVASGDGNS